MSSRSVKRAAPTPPSADFGILLALALRVYLDELHSELAKRGYEDLRPAFGVTFRALMEKPLTLTQLAVQLGTSKQAMAKTVAELLKRGFVVQHGSEIDRRTKALALTDRGRGVVAAATEIGGRVESRLAGELGTANVAAMRAALEHLVVSGGGAAEMKARRTRAVW